MNYLSQALKEWAVVVEALAAGELILLLRKGGIREVGGRFQPGREQQVWLYPTTEHQQAHLLRSPYDQRLGDWPAPDASGSSGQLDSISLSAWAEITHGLPLTAATAVAALGQFHIWSEAFVAERLAWKPNSPLWLLLLRTYRLASPVMLPVRPEYGGCRSWIDLGVSLPTQPAEPVLTPADYTQQVQAIFASLNLDPASAALSTPVR